MFKKNCCDGIYNSFDIHFTSLCDNKCAHCIDTQYCGVGAKHPDVDAIMDTILENVDGFDDVLFLGGEPCLFLNEMLECVKRIKSETSLKVFVTTAMPRTCYDNYGTFVEILHRIDGLNISVQHDDEIVADNIRGVKSTYDRQLFYSRLPYRHKIRINLNLVKPHLHTRGQIIKCLKHYDAMGFNSIKVSEIQHGKEYFTSLEEVFDYKMKSPYSGGCQTYLPMGELIPGFKTPLLLKRSCFLCEETLNASAMDGLKVLGRMVMPLPKNKYGVIYGDGQLSKGWI